MNAPIDRFASGTRVEHWFAGQGTVLRHWQTSGKGVVEVRWDKGGSGLAYKAHLRDMRTVIDGEAK